MKIGSLKLFRPLCLAPMEDITDMPFRRIARRLGADLVCTEFVSSEALCREIDKAKKLLVLHEEERPAGVQIFGGTAEAMQEAVKVVERFKPDFIDINSGCWSKRHALRGECAGLLLDLPRLESILKSVVAATKIPVTLKTRLGWDEKKIVILEVAKIAEQSGMQALTLHCRTRCQGYKGKAEWGWLEKVKKAVRIPLIGNGDVLTPENVQQMFDLGCDGVMIGRGALVNPWIFKQTKYFLKTKKHLDLPSLDERLETCLAHLKLNIEDRGMKYGTIHFRKFYAGYFRSLPGAAKLRMELMQAENYEAVANALEQFRQKAQ